MYECIASLNLVIIHQLRKSLHLQSPITNLEIMIGLALKNGHSATVHFHYTDGKNN
jgi:hypothetical protein